MSEKGKIIKNTNQWLDIRKTLSKCSERDLLGLIADLYALSKQNKDFLEARFIKNDEVLARYKSIIKKCIAPGEPWKNNQQISLKDAKKAISDYKKATNDTISLIDLMVCYVEYGTDFLCEFGDMYEQYYCSLESVFSNALKLMKTFEYQEVISFEQRLHVVVKKAEHMGWGYYDAISDMLNEAYPKP